MNFEFSDEQHQIRDQARSVLNDNCTTAVVRRVLEGEELYAAELWRQVVDLGWPATTIPEEYGGLGLSHLELVVIAEELGRACAPIPFASSVYLATEAILAAGSPEQKSTWLPKLATGEVIGTLAYAEGPGQTTPANLGTTLVNGKLSGCKSTVADAEIAQLMIVVVKSNIGDGASLCLCPCPCPYPLNSTAAGSKIKCDHVNTIDPSLNHADVSFDAADAELLGAEGEGWALLEKILDRAAILYAWEQLGGAERCLEMAKDYSMQRYAFGRPVGSFQAIKHKLAEMYVKNTLARSNGYFGAWALATNAIELPLAAATARVGSTQAYYYASKENIQTHGGMGYTWEFDCQFYYRRAKVLAVAIGSERLWQDKLISASDIALAV